MLDQVRWSLAIGPLEDGCPLGVRCGAPVQPEHPGEQPDEPPARPDESPVRSPDHEPEEVPFVEPKTHVELPHQVPSDDPRHTVARAPSGARLRGNSAQR